MTGPLPTTFIHTHTHTYDPRHLDTLGASLTRAQLRYKVLRGFGMAFKAFNPFWRPLLLHFVLNGEVLEDLYRCLQDILKLLLKLLYSFSIKKVALSLG